MALESYFAKFASPTKIEIDRNSASEKDYLYNGESPNL